jgi:hypothetical protein
MRYRDQLLASQQDSTLGESIMPPVKEGFDPSIFPDTQSQQAAGNVWDAAKKRQPKFQPVGTFQVEITGATLERAQSSGRLQLHYELVVLAGESKDVILHKRDGLETDEQTSIAQSGLKRLGIPVAKINFDALPAHLMQLRGKHAVVQCKQNGEFYNIYFQKLMGETIGQRKQTTVSGASAGSTGRKRF